MTKGRLEAFTDAVIAIILTIMVLEMKVPHDVSWHALSRLYPVFLSYVLSFVYLGIYWNNHHHLWHAVKQVDGAILWANLHLMFWLSLVPFATGWMGENHFAPLPVAVYGFVLLCSAISYEIMVKSLLRHHGRDSILARAIGRDVKGKVSTALYVAAVPLAFFLPLLSCLFYVIVAGIWLVPDRRFEKALAVAGE
jgi:uncharacterized membrane protein